MTKSTIKRLFPNRKYCIVNRWNDGIVEYLTEVEGNIWYINRKDKAYVGTKRELEIILNGKLYQFKLRGAKIIPF